MKPLKELNKEYFGELKKRSRQSRVYQSHQLTGLEIANLLNDPEHKSLYMQLAKKHGEAKMLQLAKTVAERNNIANKGAYFMKLLHTKD